MVDDDSQGSLNVLVLAPDIRKFQFQLKPSKQCWLRGIVLQDLTAHPDPEALLPFVVTRSGACSLHDPGND